MRGKARSQRRKNDQEEASFCAAICNICKKAGKEANAKDSKKGKKKTHSAKKKESKTKPDLGVITGRKGIDSQKK